MTKKDLIIDADTIAYRNAALCQTNYDVISNETGRTIDYVTAKKHFYEKLPDTADPQDYELVPTVRPVQTKNGVQAQAVGYHGVKLEMGRITERFDWIRDYEVCIHEGGNFREDIATIKEYKGNRKEKPLFLQDVKDYMKVKYKDKYTGVTGEETDDYVAQVGWKAFYDCQDKVGYSDISVVIAHIDKDLDQIPGIHYNYDKDLLYKISVVEAARCFWGQMLTGDSSDNIPGIPLITKDFKKQWGIRSSKGYGDKAVESLFKGVKTPQEMAERVVLAYKDGYGDNWLDVAEEVSKLLYLRRQPDELFSFESCLKRLKVIY